MFIAALALALAAAPAQNIKLASAGFKTVGIPEQQATFFSDFFAAELSKVSGYQVTTATELSGLLGLERQKELLGCNDQSESCAAELLGALGADAIITGTTAKVGNGFAVTVKISATRDGEQLAAASGELDDESAVLPWLGKSARSMAVKLRQRYGGAPTASELAVGSRVRARTVAPAIAGGVLLAGSVVTYAIAKDKADKITASDSPYQSPGEANRAATEANTLRAVAFVAGGAGLVALGIAAFLSFNGDDSAVAIAPQVTPTLAGVVIGGRFL